MGYILGLGNDYFGGDPICCQTCNDDIPCKMAPTSVGASRYGSVGVFEYWFVTDVSRWTTGATWACPDLALYSGATFNTATGSFGWNPTAPGTQFVPYTITTGCGVSYGIMSLAVGVFFCRLSLNTSGGDAGYDETFDVTGDFTSSRSIVIDFESYTVKDRLQIYADGVLIYDSGCVGAHIVTSATVPAGTTSARVLITPNCDGGSGTVWVLGINCS